MAIRVVHEDFGFKALPTPAGDIAVMFGDDSGNRTDIFTTSVAGVDTMIERLQQAKAQALGLQVVQDNHKGGQG